MSSPNSSLSVGLVPKLTNSELQVLNIIKEGIIDNNLIAKRRQTGIRNIQKIVKNLKQKGALGISSPIANEMEGSSELNGIRIHAEQFTIIPITKSQKYIQSIGKKIQIDLNTIIIHSKSIDYYSNQSFFGSDSYKATEKSMTYLDRIIRTMENDLQCILIKPRSQNITRVKSEYAHINNGLAVKLHREGEKFKCRADDDGKVWFIIDNSWNLKEAETIGKKAHEDMQNTIEPFFNDMRDKENYLPSDTKSMIDNLAKASNNLVKANLDYKPMFLEMNENISKFAQAMTFYGEHFKSHAGLIKEGTQIFKEINRKKNQRKVSDWL